MNRKNVLLVYLLTNKQVKITITEPLSPSNLRVITLDENTVKLRWTNPQPNAKFKGYVIEKYSNSDGNWEALAKSDREDATIDGLIQTESYKFRVAFELDDGSIGKFAESDMVCTSLMSPTKLSSELKGLFE